MFKPVELAESTAHERKLPNHDALDDLLIRLRVVEYMDYATFSKAFPNEEENRAFFDSLERVIWAEKTRKEPSFTDPEQPYLPHHSVESFFWVFLYFFSRALPKGLEKSERQLGIRQMVKFYDVMMNCQDGKEALRREYMFSPKKLAHLLHPKLGRLTPLFQCMATYLSIPWKDYMAKKDRDVDPMLGSLLSDSGLPWDDSLVKEDHAHMAFLRLLLAEILDCESNNTYNFELENLPRGFY